MERDELLRIVREIGREILEESPDLTQKQKELDQAAQAQLNADAPQDLYVTVYGQKAWLSLIKHFQLTRNTGIPEGKDIKYNLGQIEEELAPAADVARELKDGKVNVANALIKTINKGQIKRARPYAGFMNPRTGKFVPLGIKPDLDKLTAINPEFSKQFAESIECLIATGQISKDMSMQADLIGEVAALWFGQEPAREPANIIMSIMSLELVKQGLLSIGEAIIEHPASTFGYQEAVKELNEDLYNLMATQARVKPARQRIIEKEIAILQKWFETKATTSLNNASNDRESIKRIIMVVVKNFYTI